MPHSARNLQPVSADGYPTPTSDLQAMTEHVLQTQWDKVVGSDPTQIPKLVKDLHIQFIARNIVQGFPARYTSQDASQAWLVFWSSQSFSVLGVGLDDQMKQRIIDTVLAMQHPTGGFGGGPGQIPHLLSTYASVCSLAIVGRPGEKGGWDQIDREGMYKYFMSLKQPDGSFLVTQDGEVDVRGTYCLLTVVTMLDMLTEELLEGVPEFVASLQTYEGGFCNASFPDWSFGLGRHQGNGIRSDVRPPLGEAHGGYTFCATASWTLLQPYLDVYYKDRPRPTINLLSLLRWCTQMQGGDIEIGGFRGRTNKLVDGCYSWWVGGCLTLVEGLLGVGGRDAPHKVPEESAKSAKEEGWDDVDDSLFNRPALQEYVLCAAQHSAGGLVDKPPKPADAYHTLYCLSGLSAAQRLFVPSEERRAEVAKAWNKDIKARGDEKLTLLRQSAFISLLSWIEAEGTTNFLGGEQNRLNATQPVTNLTFTHTEGVMAHFYAQDIPRRGFVAKSA